MTLGGNVFYESCFRGIILSGAYSGADISINYRSELTTYLNVETKNAKIKNVDRLKLSKLPEKMYSTCSENVNFYEL